VRLFPAKIGSHRDALVKSIEHMPQQNVFGGINPRQASPLWTRVIKADNQYHLLFSILPSKLKRRTDYGTVSALLDRHFSAPNLEIEGWNHE
jgi:CRISPR-associated protein Cmr1